MTQKLEQVVDAYDSIAEKYDAIYSNDHYENENVIVYELLKRHLGGIPVGTTLDMGCGTGALLDNLPLFNADDYVGVDLSSRMLGIARSKHPEHMFVQADFTEAHGFVKYDNVISTWGSPSFVPVETALQAIGLSLCSEHGRFFAMFTGLARSPADVDHELYVIHTALEIAQAAQLNPHIKLQGLFGLTSKGNSGVRLIHHQLDESEFIIAVGVSR